MTTVYLVSRGKIEVHELIKETEKSFIIVHKGANKGRYPLPKLRSDDIEWKGSGEFGCHARNSLATLCKAKAKEELDKQFCARSEWLREQLLKLTSENNSSTNLLQ